MGFLRKLLDIGVGKTSSIKEQRRVKILNLTTYIALIHAIFFLAFDYYLNSLDGSKILILVFEIFFFSAILYFQYLGHHIVARTVFTITIFTNLLFHCNYAFQGYYGEYQYLVIPLFSLFLFDRNYIHYSLLVLSIVAFYVPNYLLAIYPEKYFGYMNVLLLFTGVFIIVNYFRLNSERNENKLKKQLNDNHEIQKELDISNKELESRNKLQNHFFVNIAHELGTPITVLKGQANRLQKEFNEGHFNDGLDKMKFQVGKIETLLGNIIDIAKLEVNSLVLTKEIYPINQFLQNTFIEFQPLFLEKNIELNLSLSDTDAYVNVDKLYFDRVLSNILANAYKYTNTGGQVTINALEKNDFIEIRIEDNGIGIPESDLKLIFDRFYQSENHINQSGGSGIGLAFSKEIIIMHGGEINAIQSKSGGTTICIRMAVAKEKNFIKSAFFDQENKLPSISAFYGKTILIVDDNREMREHLSFVLQDFNLLEASNGEEALSLIENKIIDAIVTDYMMPVMDGKSFVNRLKKINSTIPIIMITARVDFNNKLEMLQLGIDDYLTKPFSEEELILRLQNTMVNQAARANFAITDLDNEPMGVDESSTLIRSKEIVMANIDNPYFGVAQLSEELHFSERQLYRILKKETGLSPNLFIRELKLLRVRTQVEQNRLLSLQELALSVGLSNGTYLNQLYKNRFGKALNA